MFLQCSQGRQEEGHGAPAWRREAYQPSFQHLPNRDGARSGCACIGSWTLSEYVAVLKIAGTPHVDDTTGFQPDTREAIPGWDALLFIYAIFFVPTFFALIVGVNLLVWARARINYVFIFGMLPIL